MREKYGSRKSRDELREGWFRGASLRRERKKEELDEKKRDVLRRKMSWCEEEKIGFFSKSKRELKRKTEGIFFEKKKKELGEGS